MRRNAFTTKRLLLRPYRPADYAAWREYLTTRLDPRTRFDHGALAPEDCTRTIFRQHITRHAAMAKDDQSYLYAVFLKKTGAVIGTVDISVIRREHYGLANIGYKISNRYQRQGYGAEALSCAFRIAFDDLQLHRLEAVMDPRNKASIQLAKHVGMANEGIRKFYWNAGDRWENVRVYTVTPEMIQSR